MKLVHLALASALFWSALAHAELPAKIYSQGEFSYATGPTPDFVEERAIADKWDASSASKPGNWRNWLNDSQVDRRGEGRRLYRDSAYEPRTIELVGQAAKFSIQFNPLYQRLTLHRVELRRDGEWSDRFDASKVSLARRETGFESNMADGLVTAMLLLADVRVGDVVRVAYTVDGSNPVLAGSDSDFLYLAWIDPTLDRHARLLFPASVEPDVRHAGDQATIRTRHVGDHVEVVADAHDVPGYPNEGGYPNWYERLPLVEVAPRRSWADVVSWALPLYPEAALPADLESRLAQWAKIEDPYARAFEVLRTVQRDVRYFGTEMGDNTHKPAAPTETWARRYGDCKDKAYLTATLLRRLGIEAEPALVSMSEGKGISERLPSAAVFDHVIVRARIDGQSYWLDATLPEQHGDLRKLDVRDYGVALPVVAGSAALVPVRSPAGVANTVSLLEKFLPDVGGDTIDLRVETSYTGLRAESMRYQLNSQGLDELGRNYANFYRKRFSELEVVEPLRAEDPPGGDRLVLREHYRLNNAWTLKLGNQRQLELYADALTGDVALPTTLDRTGPLDLAQHSSLRHRIVLEVPKGWSLPEVPAGLRVHSDEIDYQRSASASGNHLELEHRLDVLADYVPNARIPDYLRDLRSVREDMSLRVLMRASGGIADAERSERLQKLLRDAAQGTEDAK